MRHHTFATLVTFITLLNLAGCGGGGGGGSSSQTPMAPPAQPSASDDQATTLVNTPITVAVTSNDVSVDVSSLAISQQPSNGDATLQNGGLVYTPTEGFTGTDSLRYQVNGENGTALEASVTITVNPITTTRLNAVALAIPTSGFTSQNNAELGMDVLVSPEIIFNLDPNAVSFSISLTGSDVGDTPGNLFIAELVAPDGAAVLPLRRSVVFCDPDYCSGLVPRRPDQVVTSGSWTLRLGTVDSNLNGINLANMALSLAQRIGPGPGNGVTLPVTPHLTASSISPAQLEAVLNTLTTMANSSNISLQIDPVVMIDDPRFTEVSKDFNDPDTGALVRQGADNRINLFFIEDFSGAGGSGLLGISGGLPGTFGQSSQFNGVLINATANLGAAEAVYTRNTAEIAFHEMGHYLGLYHTSERQFSPNDVIDDTPECDPSFDRTTSGIVGVADVEECPDGQNLMFWNTDFTGNKQPLSADQRQLILRSPIALPTGG